MTTPALGDSRRVIPLLLILGAPVVAAAGVLAGALPLSAAEPSGLFVDCGPAVFGRPSPLPDPACSAAYAPLPQITFGLFVMAAACAIVGVAILMRQRRRNSVPV